MKANKGSFKQKSEPMLIGASKDEPDVADLMKNRNIEDGSDEEEDNQEGMGDVDLDDQGGVVDDDSDEESKK